MVFSWTPVPLDKIYKLAEKYNAMVMVDESHSAGVVGRTGRGVTELFNLKGKIEIKQAPWATLRRC
jgi:glycine C-acetyltransferase